MLVYDARTKKAWLYAMNLPECPNGTTYQLWAINDKPVSVGTFHMDSGETAHLLVSRVPEFSKAKSLPSALSLQGACHADRSDLSGQPIVKTPVTPPDRLHHPGLER